MKTFRPKLVEMLNEQNNQEETVNHQQLQRGNKQQNQNTDTTWDSSSSEERDRHQYETVISEKGQSNSQRDLIKEVAKTIGPNKQQQIRPHKVWEQEGPMEHPGMTPQHRAERADGGPLSTSTSFTPQHRAERADGGPLSTSTSITHKRQKDAGVQDVNRRANYDGHNDTVYHGTPRRLPTRPLDLRERDFTSERNRLDTWMSEQEDRRETINLQMANIMKLNSRLDSLGANNSIYGTLEPNGINDREHYHMLNIVASTDPEMLHQDYATRLAMMGRIEERLEGVLKEKSEQVKFANEGASLEKALEATRISLRQLGVTASQNLTNLPLSEYRRLKRY